MSIPLPDGVWRASQMARMPAQSVPSGFTALDAELPGGGWPVGMISELIAPEPGIGELRLLVPTLRQLTRRGRIAILLAPPHIPYAPALASFGIIPERVLVIEANHAADRLWAIEQTLKSASFGCLLCWLPGDRTRPEHLRRLQQAAQDASGPGFVFRSLPAQFEPSPAPMRLLLLPRPDEQISVQILKRRGPLLANPLLLPLPRPVSAIRLRPQAIPTNAANAANAANSVSSRHASADPASSRAGPQSDPCVIALRADVPGFDARRIRRQAAG